MKKILVIGGAGYIGSHVVLALKDKGIKLDVLDNLSTGQLCNIPSDVKLHQGDILDRDFLDQVFKGGYDAVIHLAAFKAPGESMEYPEKYSLNNISGTINIINAMAKHGIKKLVFSSTAAVYGAPEYLPIDEKHPKNPINYYGFTKMEVERILEWYSRLDKISYVALRYFNAAGYDPEGRVPGLEQNPANLLPIIMETAIGKRKELQIFGDDYDTNDGSCIRDYIHVSDLAEAHVKALNYLDINKKSLAMNLGSEYSVSVKEMINQTMEITGIKIPFSIGPRRPGDPASVLASSDLAREKLNWKAERSDISLLIESTWNQYKSR